MQRSTVKWMSGDSKLNAPLSLAPYLSVDTRIIVLSRVAWLALLTTNEKQSSRRPLHYYSLYSSTRAAFPSVACRLCRHTLFAVVRTARWYAFES